MSQQIFPSSGGGASTLAADTDVQIAAPADGQLLTYDGASSKWKNKAAAAGGGGGGLTTIVVAGPPDAPPQTPTALDDEFNGTSLNGKWTRQQQGAITDTYANGRLVISNITAGNLWLNQPIPAAPCEFTAKFTIDQDNTTPNGQNPCIGIGVGDGTKLQNFFFGYINGAWQFQLMSFSNWNTYAASPVVLTSTWGYLPTLYMRLKDDGVNIVISASPDGFNWKQIGSVVRLSYLAALTVVGIYGLAATGGVGGYTCDWFRRTDGGYTPATPGVVPVPVSLANTILKSDPALAFYASFDANGTDSKTGTVPPNTAVTFVPGKFGNAASFDGATSFLNYGNVASEAGDLSICCWINVKALPAAGVQWLIAGKGAHEANSATNYELILRNDAGVYYLEYREVAALGRSHKVALPLAVGTWFHVCATVAHNASLPSIYINGLQGTLVVDDTSAASYAQPTNALGLYVGSNQLDATPKYFNGLIDDLAVFSRALNPSDVYLLAIGGALTAPMGSSAIAYNALPASLNVTTEGALDWLVWANNTTLPDFQSNWGTGAGGVVGTYRKKMGGLQIFGLGPVGTAVVNSTAAFPSLVVSSSTVDARQTVAALNFNLNGNNVQWIPGANNVGLEFTVPCDTFTRVLRIYVSNGNPYTVTCVSSDGSINHTESRASSNDQIVITYNGQHDGGSMTVYVGNDGASTSNISITVITLSTV